MSNASTEIQIGELSPSLAFGTAYYAVSSIGTRLTNFIETYTEDGFIGSATFSSPIPNSENRLQVTIHMDSTNPVISLKIQGAKESKIKVYLTEIAKRISKTISKFSKAPGTKLAQAAKAVTVERKLDEAIHQLLSEPDYQKVYVNVADARERLIRLGGVFDPATLQMGAVLSPLVGRTGKIPKDVHEQLALNLLLWKKHVKQVIDTLTG